MQSQKINQVVEQVENFIRSPRLDSGNFEEQFQQSALALYDLHRQYNPVYSKYDVGQLDDWEKIPLMPISEYKYSDVGLVIEGTMPFPGVEFYSSGTTVGDKSKHRMFSTQTYRLSIIKGLNTLLLDSITPRYRVVLLSPDLTNSSLFYMMQYLSDQLDYRGLREQFYQFNEEQALRSFIESLTHEEHPVILFGTSLALHDLMMSLKNLQDVHEFSLPIGSYLIETGGWKGRDIKITPELLSEAAGKFFGIPEWNLIREYSMSELSSQLYSWNSPQGSFYHSPHWLEPRIVEPLTQQKLQLGESGIIGFVDLANVWSCPFVLTEDVGHFQFNELWGEHTLVLEGRVVDAPEKGCSLTYAQATTLDS